MQVIHEFGTDKGGFKVVKQERAQGGHSPLVPLREWTEYQVRSGRMVLSRHNTLPGAMRAARKRLEELWASIAAPRK